MIAGVKLHNLFSYEDAEFEFPKGVTLIEGWNTDDSTPEGSGKSAVPNAITWVLFGKIPKDATIDSVIREGTKSGYGLVKLRNGAEIYRSRGPNDLYFKRTEDGAEVRGKDAKETQAWIQDLLGMGFETFCQAVYFPQNYGKKFITASESEKAAIITEIQDLNDFTEARKAAAKLCTAQEQELYAAESQLNLARGQVTTLEKSLLENEGLLEEFQTQKASRLEELDEAIEKTKASLEAIGSYENPEALEEQLRSVQAKVRAYDNAASQIKLALLEAEKAASERADAANRLPVVEAELKELEAQLRDTYSARGKVKLEAISDEEAEVKADLKALELDRTEVKARLLTLTHNSDSKRRLQKRMGTLDADLAKRKAEELQFQTAKVKMCPTCGAEMTHKHVAEHLASLRESISTLESEKEAVASELSAIPEFSSQELEAELSNLDGVIAQIKSKLSGFDSERLLARSLDLELRALRSRLESTEAAKALLDKQINTQSLAGDEQGLTVEDIRSDLKETIALLDTYRKNEEKLHFAIYAARETQREKQSLQSELARLEKTRAVEAARSGESFEKVIASCKARLEEARQTMGDREASRKAAFDQIARLETLKQGFSEIKQYVFKGLLQELTKKTNKFLQELFEVPVSVRFSNEGEDGEISKIQVLVTIYGEERPLALFSGGQARRIQIAVDLALAETIASRSHKVMDVRFFDEPFKDLSEISMEKAVRLFETLKGSTVLIEHNSVAKSICSNVMRVELQDKVSRRVS